MLISREDRRQVGQTKQKKYTQYVVVISRIIVSLASSESQEMVSDTLRRASGTSVCCLFYLLGI